MVAIILYGRHAVRQDPAVDIVGNVLKTLDTDYFKFFHFVEDTAEYPTSREVFRKLREECKKFDKIDFILDIHSGPQLAVYGPEKTIFSLSYIDEWTNQSIQKACKKLGKSRELKRADITELEDEFKQSFTESPKQMKDRLMQEYSPLREYKEKLLLLEFLIPIPLDSPVWAARMAKAWKKFRDMRKLYEENPALIPRATYEYAFFKTYSEPWRKLLKSKPLRNDVSEALDEVKVILVLLKEHFSKKK